jgi:N-acetylmuramoyl-L-alanine amidase
MKTIRTIVKSMSFRSIGVIVLLLIAGSFIGTNSPQRAKIKVVCIDPGHGGKDPGCHGDEAKEKDVALAIALKLGKYITDKYPNMKVVYTRKTDVFVELDERAAIANRNNADLFICIHCNSACVRDKRAKKDICNETAEGAETYIMGLHKNNGNLEVAKRENDAALYEDDYQTKYNMNIASDEAMIILSTYQNLYQKQSMRFAEICQEQFSKRAGRTNKGVKQAGFLVLWKTSMPSVLIESGFLTNPIEERFLGSDKGQAYMASCIFRAFRSWKDEIEGAVKPNYSDDLENEKPFVLSHADTAGLRKPVNYVLNPKPIVATKNTEKDSALVKVDTPVSKNSTVVASNKPTNPLANPETTKGIVKSPTTESTSVATKPAIKNSDASQNTPPDANALKPPPVTETKPSPQNPPVTETKPAVKTETQKPASATTGNTASKPVDTNSAATGTVFRVQFLSSDKILPDQSPLFKGVKDVWHYEHKGAHKYTAGMYSNATDAAKRMDELRKAGFKDAFVVVFDEKGNRVR